MKFLHTSDWHIGRKLYGAQRFDEFQQFFAWLLNTIEENEIDALLVAGDVFDNSTPGTRAQAIYYRFLHDVAKSCCQHVVIIGGNHDSPTFLDAPRKLLNAFNIHVVGNIDRENLSREVLVLKDNRELAQAVVCAVPYLRDRDVRTAEPGETIDNKERKLKQGIREHYRAVAERAEAKRLELGTHLPIIGMGHLFAAGGKVTEGDGVRDLYVGSLAHVSAAMFPECFDYLALGHLHAPQLVDRRETIRYCGSPLPMGFGEAKQQKQVYIIEFNRTTPSVVPVQIPVFQKLQQIKGDWSEINNSVMNLVKANEDVWLDIIYEGLEVRTSLRADLEELTVDTAVEILRVKNTRSFSPMANVIDSDELSQLTPNSVFQRCLDANNIPEEQRSSLRAAHDEILACLYDQGLGI